MHQLKKYCTELLLTCFLLVFIFFKASTLHLPYFWDELGVYARAALYLHDHELSLMPGDLPPELSRGHPLLYNLLNAVSFSVFNDNVFTGHATALFFSILFILAVYSVTKKIFNNIIALCVSVSVLVQPVFVTQSVMMLPEILLALCMLLTIYFFSKEKYLSYAAVSSLAILIKESAIILPFVVLCSALVINLAGRNNIFSRKYVFAFVPLLVFGIFLIIQKQQNGWYLFPYHAAEISFDKDSIISQFADFSKFLTMEQGRIVITILLLLMYPVHIFLNRHNTEMTWKSSILYILLLSCFFFLYNDINLLYCIMLFLTASAFLILYLRKPFINEFVVYLIFMLAGGLVFSSLNFYMNRYILFLFPPMFILFFYSLRSFHKNQYILYSVFTCIILVIACRNMESKTFHFDEDMSYRNYLQQQQDVMLYITDTCTGADINIFANFPMYHAFTDPRLGYTELEDDKDFHLMKNSKRTTVFDYIIIAKPGSYDYVLPAADSLVIDKEFNSDIVKITVYSAGYK